MSSSPICFLPGLLKISANVTRGLRRGGGGGGWWMQSKKVPERPPLFSGISTLLCENLLVSLAR